VVRADLEPVHARGNPAGTLGGGHPGGIPMTSWPTAAQARRLIIRTSLVPPAS